MSPVCTTSTLVYLCRRCIRTEPAYDRSRSNLRTLCQINLAKPTYSSASHSGTQRPFISTQKKADVCLLQAPAYRSRIFKANFMLHCHLLPPSLPMHAFRDHLCIHEASLCLPPRASRNLPRRSGRVRPARAHSAHDATRRRRVAIAGPCTESSQKGALQEEQAPPRSCEREGAPWTAMRSTSSNILIYVGEQKSRDSS